MPNLPQITAPVSNSKSYSFTNRQYDGNIEPFDMVELAQPIKASTAQDNDSAAAMMLGRKNLAPLTVQIKDYRDFSVYLLFDLNTDTLYGYRRVLVVENPSDADCKLPEKLLNTLTAQYGEPTTYPGLENRISTHLDRLSTDAVGSGEVYNEYWSVSENCDASLGVSFLPDGRLFVDIVCQTPRT